MSAIRRDAFATFPSRGHRIAQRSDDAGASPKLANLHVFSPFGGLGGVPSTGSEELT